MGEKAVVGRASFLERIDGNGRGLALDATCVAVTDSASATAEQFRVLYHRLARMRASETLPVIAITSAMHGEGKTFTAVNLALTAARANRDRRVALIDCDLRRPSVGALLGLVGHTGLAQVLAGRAELEVAMSTVEDLATGVARRRGASNSALTVIAAGELAGEGSAALLSSRRMTLFLEDLRGSFDEIYLDAPPAIGNADGPIVCAQADATLMVVRANDTQRESVMQALDSLGGVAVVGLVLNRVELRSVPRRALGNGR